jgi:hypothetical protein
VDRWDFLSVVVFLSHRFRVELPTRFQATLLLGQLSFLIPGQIPMTFDTWERHQFDRTTVCVSWRDVCLPTRAWPCHATPADEKSDRILKLNLGELAKSMRIALGAWQPETGAYNVARDIQCPC